MKQLGQPIHYLVCFLTINSNDYLNSTLVTSGSLTSVGYGLIEVNIYEETFLLL